MSNPLTISTRAPKTLDKEKTKLKTELLKTEIAGLQKILYAQGKHSLLIILQGLDASGKDGLIADVFSGLNPLGCSVFAYKAPTAEELDHDFLWRIHKNTPGRGMIHIYNRSHYEDLLSPVVNGVLQEGEIKRRITDINNFEHLLKNHSTHVIKFYLHISPEEQKERLTERKTNPTKFWKHNDGDWATSKKWKEYMDAYGEIFKHCNSPEWNIIPADQNWYKEYLVATKVLEELQALKLTYPTKVEISSGNAPKKKRKK
ncbi:MAG: polyphosphate kinase [Bacteroidota bacterium]|nr:polyphosphate kinase [Bacteroidota bacterium]